MSRAFAVLTAGLSVTAQKSIAVSPLGEYPAYSGSVDIQGKATMAFAGTQVTITYDLTGVEAACATADAAAANSCGIHIHSGTSCADSTLPGGHYYSTATDPWKTAVYVAATDGTAKGSLVVDYGYSWQQSAGHVLVVHNRAGGRVTCTPIADETVYVPALGDYPGYTGSVDIQGDAIMAFAGTQVTITYDLTGVEAACATADAAAANSCGIHIHSGTSCADSTLPGGHYYSTATDPWKTAVYVAATDGTAKGSLVVDYGYEWKDAENRVLVVHNRAGGRVTCKQLKKAQSDPDYQVKWDYDKDGSMGPKKWKNTYPGCDKKMQSPINLKTGAAKSSKGSNLPDLKISPKPDKDHMTTWTVHNTGHSLEMTPDKTAVNYKNYKLTGGIMDNTYDLDSVQVHWRAEHEVNGNRQEAEVHIAWYTSDAQAANQPWTVFAVMVNEGSKEKDLDPLYDAAKAVAKYDAVASADLSLRHLLPKDWDEDYYTYYGSTTTPPCTEGVQWVLPRYMLKSSDDQIDDLKDMKDMKKKTMKDLYRNEQKLNARQVFKSFKSGSGGFSFFG